MPEVMELLHQQQDMVRRLGIELDAQFKAAASARQLFHTATQLRCALSIHMRLQEDIFYPHASSAVRDIRHTQAVALEEHRVMRWLLAQLQGPVEPRRGRWLVLLELVERHLRREEGEVFPAVQSGLTQEQLKELRVALRLTEEGLGNPDLPAWPHAELAHPARQRSTPLKTGKFNL